MEKIVLGLSGAADSAVAGSLLKEQGSAGTGLYLHIGLRGSGARGPARVPRRQLVPAFGLMLFT